MGYRKETSGLVLVVDDNRDLAETLIDFLEAVGFEVDYAANGSEGHRLALENSYDAIVLDGSLPRLDGLDVCRRLRAESRKSTPIIFVTARDTVDDKVAGLAAGADDFMTKPFAPKELEARLRALIRRDRREVSAEILVVGDLSFDPATLETRRAGKRLDLTPTGMQILQILMRESPRVVSRKELEQEIWGGNPTESDTLRSHLYNLRKSIDRGFEVPLLHTLPTTGYRLSAPEPTTARAPANPPRQDAAWEQRAVA